MNKLLFSGLLSFGVLVMASPGASAVVKDFTFTYDYTGATIDYFGIQRNVRYDAAMLLKDPSLTGAEITGVSVDIPVRGECECAPEATAWLTRELALEGDANSADICTAIGTITNYGTDSEPQLRLDINFPEAYTLTDDGVYVGYTVTVTNCKTVNGWTAKYPLVLVNDVDKPQSFMLHCNNGTNTLPPRYSTWTDCGETTHQALAMRVNMRGEQTEVGGSVEPQQTLYVAPGTTGYVYTNLTNHAETPITSIEYSYIVGEGEDMIRVSKEFTLDEPLEGSIGAYTTLDLPFEAPDNVGLFEVKVSVDKINGEENGYADSATLTMDVVPFLPYNRPLIEDYTGFWCGYCPAVYVGVKQMAQKYGEEFLSISYHSNDQLQTVPTGLFPSSTYGLPKVYMENRDEYINYNNMEYLWLRKRRELAPADLKVKLTWSDATKKDLRVDTDVKFVYDDPEADYRISFVMVEDGMSDSDWGQENQYWNENREGPFWDLFCGKTYIVKGLVYDDVVVSSPAPTGIVGSLPKAIESEVSYNVTGVLSLADATSQYSIGATFGKNVIKDKNKLRVVALLIDGKTGFVRNSVTTGYSGDAVVYDPLTDKIETITSDANANVSYYTLQGVKTQAPIEGQIYICVSNGKASKIIF